MIRPTPETDARTYVPSIGASTVPADFARKLERERDEARELLASEKITRNHIIKRSVEVEQERDKARAVADELASAASHCLGWHDCRLNIGKKIAAALKRWRKSQ